MLTPFANTIELGYEDGGFGSRDDGKPWSLMSYHGWITLNELNIRTGTYFLTIYRLLVQLEQMIEPRERQPEHSLTASITGVWPAVRDPMIGRIVWQVERIEKESRDLGLLCTAKRLAHIREYLGENETRLRVTMDFIGDAGMQTEVRVLRQALIDDLDDRIIFFPELEKFKKYYGKFTELFGIETLRAFRPANKDINSAHNCYVMDEPTASVFHSMRAAEFGLQALALRLNPNADLEKLQWGPIIGDLSHRIEKMHDPKQPPDPDRQAKIEFYAEGLDKCRFFKRWRDAVMHTRGFYEDPEALQVLTHMREFLQFLAKNGLSLPERLPKDEFA